MAYCATTHCSTLKRKHDRPPFGGYFLGGFELDKVDWVKAWDDDHRRSMGRADMQSDALWTRYWNTIADEYIKEFGATEPFYREIIEYLRRESMFRKGDEVLDVGCGPGNYSLLFAEDAGHVDALDSAGHMLEVLAGKAEKRRLGNVRAINSKWEDHAIEKKYDLVFSSMSPAIHDSGTLLKMERCSRRGCCLVTYGGTHEYPAIKDLWGSLVGEYRASDTYLYVYPYHVLSDMGRNPAVRMFEYGYGGHRMPVDMAVEHYTSFFSIFTAMDGLKIKKMRDYFNAESVDGCYTKETKLKLAVITWKVHEL